MRMAHRMTGNKSQHFPLFAGVRAEVVFSGGIEQGFVGD